MMVEAKRVVRLVSPEFRLRPSLSADAVRGEALMPPGTQVRALGEREYALRARGMTVELRVTTDLDYYEEHAQSVELWSPGNPVFTPPG